MEREYIHGAALVKKDQDKLYILSEGAGVIDEKSVIATGSDTARALSDRFADIVNVKDFGAVGDGVTDDASAFSAAAAVAVNAGVFVPFGTYVVNSNIIGNFFCFGGVTIIGSGTISSLKDLTM